MFYTKRMAGYLFALLAVVQMAAFFLYWQTTERLQIQWIVYLVYWIRNLAMATVPLITAAGVFLLFTAGHQRLWLFPILPVLSRALYYLPDHYLYYMSADMNSLDSLSAGAAITLVECAAIYGFSLLLFLVAKAVYKRTKKSTEEQTNSKIFALEDPFVKSVFFMSFTYFCLQIAYEILRAVVYLITNAGTYSIEEIITVVLSFIMHFAVLFATHAFCILYLRFARKHYKIPEDKATI